MKRLQIFAFTILLCITLKGFAQTDTEFWFAAPEITQGHGDEPIYLRFASAEKEATVTISLPARNATALHTVTIPAMQAISVNISSYKDWIENKIPGAVLSNGILIQSTTPITAYYEEASPQNSDIFSLKGNNALGTHFFIPTQTRYNNHAPLVPSAYNSFDIVAVQDNTLITITPAKDIVGHAKGIPFQIKLNRGETYSCQAVDQLASSHLAGSEVFSDKPVAITVKDDSIEILSAWDLSGDQLVPVDKTGTEYVVVRGEMSGQTNDIVSIVSTEDNNPLFIGLSPVPVAVLQKGEPYQFEVPQGTGARYFHSNKPIYAFHLTGFAYECGGALLPPIKCTGSSRVVFVRSSPDAFYLTLLVEKGAEDGFLIDGAKGGINGSSFTQVAGPSNPEMMYALIQLNVSVDQAHIVSNTKGYFHMGIINRAGGGSGCRYGYFSNYARLNLGSDATLCKGASTTLDAGPGMLSYLWNTGETTQTIKVDQPGEYQVTVSAPGCDLTDKVLVSQYKPVDFSIATKTISSQTQQFKLEAIGDPSYKYLWNTGETSSFIVVDTAGIYRATATDIYGCTYSVTEQVNDLPSVVLVPNAFTPLQNKDDALNNYFRPLFWGPKPQYFFMKIFDRWGKMIFSTIDFETGWDGTIGGQPAPTGEYIYYISFASPVNAETNLPRNKRGKVLLLR